MESVEPPPPKVRRINKTSKIRVSECIREFELPIQFPSVVLGHKPVAKEYSLTPSNTVLQSTETQLQTIDIKKKGGKGKNIKLFECPDEKIVHQISSQTVLNGSKNVNKTISSSATTSKIKSIKTLPISALQTIDSKKAQHIGSVTSSSLVKNTDSISKVKTLKLKGPDGKDLGEFQVELVDGPEKMIKRKFISIPSNLLPSKIDSQENEVVSSTQAEPVVSYSVKDVQYPGSVYQEPRIEKIGIDAGSKVKIVSNVSLNRLPGNEVTKIIQGKQMIQKIFSNTTFEQPAITTKVNNPWIKIDKSKMVVADNISTLKNNSQTNTQKVLYLKPEDHPYLKNITESGKPIALKPVKLKSLNLKTNGEKIDNMEVVNFTGTDGLTGYKNGDMDEELEKDDNPIIDTNRKLDIVSTSTKKGVKVILPKEPAKITRQISSEGSSEMESLVFSDNEIDFLDTEFLNEHEDSIEEEKSKNSSRKNKSKRRKKNSTESNSEKDSPNNDSTVDMSIVERALASVKDKSLREEALKVLASCKLGADRQIPIRPASDTISVRDTTCQTNIFGNLDPDCEEFVEVQKSEKELRRIDKTVRDSEMAFKSFHYVSTPVKENEDDNNFAKQLDKIIMDLDINQEEKKEVTNIKNVLDRPIQSTEKINRVKKQAVEDIKMLTTHDENGLTGLHHAVMKDDTRTVRRLLVILRITKNNADMRTHDNRVSFSLLKLYKNSKNTFFYMIKLFIKL